MSLWGISLWGYLSGISIRDLSLGISLRGSLFGIFIGGSTESGSSATEAAPNAYATPLFKHIIETKQENTGITSVDRSTRATLSTYNTRIQLSRLQKIYHPQSLKLRLTTEAFDGR